MVDGYLYAWLAWLIGSAVCLLVWAKWLHRLPEFLFYLLWWTAFGVLLAPAPEAPGSELWAPAIMTSVFDALNGVEGGMMRAGKSVVIGACIGAGLGVFTSLLRTRRRLANVE